MNFIFMLLGNINYNYRLELENILKEIQFCDIHNIVHYPQINEANDLLDCIKYYTNNKF